MNKLYYIPAKTGSLNTSIVFHSIVVKWLWSIAAVVNLLFAVEALGLAQLLTKMNARYRNKKISGEWMAVGEWTDLTAICEPIV
jgi:hypothetical protein